MKLRLRSLAAAGAIASLGLVVVSSQGCSSKSEGPPDYGHMAGALAGSFCSALHGCCDAAHFAYDDGSCMAQMTDQIQTAFNGYKRGKVIYNANALAACQAALRDREALCSLDAGVPAADAGFIDPITRACFDVFKGTVVPGGACNESLECATPSVDIAVSCTRDNTQPPPTDPKAKVCFQVKQHVLPGGSCNTRLQPGEHVGAQCESTLGFCDVGTDPNGKGTCKAYANINDDCAGTVGTQILCDPSQGYCDFTSRKCTAFPTDGQSCQNSSRCAKGLYCERQGTSSTCRALKPDGADCQQSNECSGGNCDFNFTNFDGGPVTGKCSTFDSSGTYDVSPRSCGFGPTDRGPRDGGIVPPPTGQSLTPVLVEGQSSPMSWLRR